MATLSNNPMMNTASGKVGNVYFRMLRGKLRVSNMPSRGRKFTPAQLENQRRFGEASMTAKHFLSDPSVKAKYQARIDNQKFTAHMVAQSDIMNAPKVQEIDASKYKGHAGNEIVVKAKDDFMVTRLNVTIISKSGEVIESGDAVRNKNLILDWHYKATVDNPDLEGTIIRVKAFDLPGNVGKMEVVI